MKNKVIILSLFTVSVLMASCNSTKPVMVGENEVSPSYTQENTQQTPTEKPIILTPAQSFEVKPQKVEERIKTIKENR